MLYISKEGVNQTFDSDLNNVIVVLDFDRTITTANSVTSWGIIGSCSSICDDYKLNNQKLYEYYRKIEIDETIDDKIKKEYMNEWMIKQIDLLSLYGFNESLFKYVLSDINTIKLRDGINDFFQILYEYHVPVLIISAGIENIIKEVLIYNKCNYSNIKVIANKFVFYKNRFYVNNQLINSANKSDIKVINYLDNISRNEVIVIGDQISDILRLDGFNKYTTIGFLNDDTKKNLKEYLDKFDLVYADNYSYYDVINFLFNGRGDYSYEDKQNQKTKKWKI